MGAISRAILTRLRLRGHRPNPSSARQDHGGSDNEWGGKGMGGKGMGGKGMGGKGMGGKGMGWSVRRHLDTDVVEGDLAGGAKQADPQNGFPR